MNEKNYKDSLDWLVKLKKELGMDDPAYGRQPAHPVKQKPVETVNPEKPKLPKELENRFRLDDDEIERGIRNTAEQYDMRETDLGHTEPYTSFFENLENLHSKPGLTLEEYDAERDQFSQDLANDFEDFLLENLDD